MTGFLRDVFKQAGALGMSGIERFMLILATAFLMVAGRRAWSALVRASLTSSYAPEGWPPAFPEWSIVNGQAGNQPPPGDGG